MIHSFSKDANELVFQPLISSDIITFFYQAGLTLQSSTYFKLSIYSFITLIFLLFAYTLTNGLIKMHYESMPVSALITGTLFMSLMKCALLLAFIPIYLKKDIRGLSWLCYVIMLYLIYTCMTALNMKFGELSDIELTKQLADRVFGGALTIVALIQFFSTTFYIRKEKIKLGLIIGKKAES